jgi:hypothetical protein
MFKYLAVALIAGFFAASASPADKDNPSADDIKKATKMVEDRLAELKAVGGQTEAVTDGPVAAALPGHAFVSVLFRQFPIGRMPPEPLKPQNVFAINPKAELKLITDAKGLEDYFKALLPPAKGDKEAKNAALAFLRLSQSLENDGFYEFEVVGDSTKVTPEKDGKKATARSVAMKGGNGDITVELIFDADGKLTKVTETSTLKPGPRPKCHATKLLDPDPVVRAIVEQDLLIMGKAAKPYLDEQRAKATPELQAAIDRIWERIVTDR